MMGVMVDEVIEIIEEPNHVHETDAKLSKIQTFLVVI